MKHIITLEDMNYETVTRIAACHGSGSAKTLDLMCNPSNGRKWFELKEHRQIVYSGPSIEEAIKLYNDME